MARDVPPMLRGKTLMRHVRTFGSLLAETFNEWIEDKAPRLGAALAYYAAFSIAPLLLLLVAIVGFFYKDEPLSRVQTQIGELVGRNGAEAIIASIEGVKAADGGIAATVIGLITLLLGATGMFGQLQDAMNTIWEVTPKPRRLWVDTLRTRVLSFALVLSICFLLLVSMVLSAALAWVSEYFTYLLPFTARVWPIVDFCVSFGVVTVLFAMIFKIMPDVRIEWNDVWLGAAVTAAMFAIGKILIGFYLGRSSFASAYGAAGSLLVLLAWVYYSSQILFFGAEFTWVYAKRYGRNFRPARGAMALTEEARIRQGIPHTKTIEEAFKGKTKKVA
jgi:membrane protein